MKPIIFLRFKKNFAISHLSSVIRHFFKTFNKLFLAPYVTISSPFLILIILLSFSCSSTEEPQQLLGGGGEANPELKTNAEALKNFQDMRFGMFVHWGPVALKGTEIGWSRGREIPISEYDSLYTRFNPTKFDETNGSV